MSDSRRRSRSRSRSRSRERDRYRRSPTRRSRSPPGRSDSRDYYGRDRRDGDRDRSRSPQRSNDRDYREDKYNRRSRSPQRSRYRSRSPRRDGDRNRRNYGQESRRFNEEGVVPWPKGEDPARHFGGGDGKATGWVEERLQIREEASAPSVWTRSPPRPDRDVLDEILAEQRAKQKKREKELKRLASQSGESDDEEDRKHKDKKSKHKKKKHKASRHKKRKRSDSSDSSSSESDERRSKRSKHKRDKRKEKRSKKDKKRGYSSDSDVPVTEASQLIQASKKEEEAMIKQFQEKQQQKKAQIQSTLGPDGEDIVGPLPLPEVGLDGNYGFAMRPGEADAMADFVSQNKRIPRRGEVGMSADQIEQFEDLGYVMSGSRHKRMNAVRIRKEGQIYSAEEKRMLATVNLQEKAARENQIVADLREMAAEKMKQAARATPQGPQLPPGPSQ